MHFTKFIFFNYSAENCYRFCSEEIDAIRLNVGHQQADFTVPISIHNCNLWHIFGTRNALKRHSWNFNSES